MANRTVKDAKSIKGTNPQYLIEKIIRSRIYDCKYWKEECFALTAELLVDKAMELKFIGGIVGGNVKPTPFLCLVLKMLQIQPEKDIIVEFIKNDEFKYVRALGAYYMRLTGTALDCYNYLEPLLNDYRKLRRQDRNGRFEVIYIDDFIDDLLREERVCDIILPRLQKRHVLEESNEIQPRVSVLENDDDDDDDDLEEGMLEEEEAKSSETEKRRHGSSSKGEKSRRRRSRSRSRSDSSPERSRKDRDRDERKRSHKHRDHSRDRGRDKRDDSRDRERRDRDRGSRRDRDRDSRRDRDRDQDRDRDRDRDRRRYH